MPLILSEIKNNIAVITLNRPEKLNAFNREMALLLQQKLTESADDKNVRAIYLTGTGKAFSAGQDISELTGKDAPAVNVILSQHYNPIITLIRNIEKPVVAAVNGVAAGAGANMALCCDIVIATRSANFIQAFSKIGLIPDSGGTFFLPRLIGFQKASALMMLGDKVSADDAEKYAMLYKVFDDENFEKESLSIAQTLAQMPTRSFALIKQALNATYSNTLAEQLALEDKLQTKASKTFDYSEGISAFLEKRPPEFKGE